jgi:hypothetical protein
VYEFAMPPAEPPTAADELILEGIVVSLDAAGAANIAPMGPRVDRDLTWLLLRPFQTSQTYQNLKQTGCGVFHVIDDVELIARAAVSQLDPPPTLTSIAAFPCPRLADCCRWFAFEVETLNDESERTTISCRVSQRGTVRDFFGFNRAKHAVLEAAILATRIGIQPGDEILRELERLATPVAKTAGNEERRAFEFLREYIANQLNHSRPPTSDL